MDAVFMNGEKRGGGVIAGEPGSCMGVSNRVFMGAVESRDDSMPNL